MRRIKVPLFLVLLLLITWITDVSITNFYTDKFMERNIEVETKSTASTKDKNISSSDNTKNTSTSVFNCDDSLYRKCKYLYATEFFDTKVGVGKKYNYMLQHRIELAKEIKGLDDVQFLTFTFDEKITNNITKQNFNRHNVSFIHIHKVGGTTLRAHAGVPVRGVKINGTKVKGGRIKGGKVKHHHFKEWHKKSNTSYYYLSTAGKYKAIQEDWGKDDHVMFAFIRDPLERFISSVGQATVAHWLRSTNITKLSFWRKCITSRKPWTLETSRQTLQCAIDYIKENGFECDAHFVPQALSLGFATQMHNVPVAVFKFEDSFKAVLSEMGINPNLKIRDGTENRKSPVLNNMTIMDYTSMLIQQVCELYEVDVIMHRFLGWDVPGCNSYI